MDDQNTTLKRIEIKYSMSISRIFAYLRSDEARIAHIRWMFWYISQVDKDNFEQTRLQRLYLREYQDITGIKRFNYVEMDTFTDEMLKIIAREYHSNGTFDKWQWFRKCNYKIDENGYSYIELDCHDDMIPIILNIKNDKEIETSAGKMLRLSTPYQMQLYLLLKANEDREEFEIDYELFLQIIGAEGYSFKECKKQILIPAQKAFQKKTDIVFEFEGSKPTGKEHRYSAIKFYIHKNKDFKDPLIKPEFKKYLTDNDYKKDPEESKKKRRDQILNGLSSDEFNELEDNDLEIIVMMARALCPEALIEHHMNKLNNLDMAEDQATLEYIKIMLKHIEPYNKKDTSRYLIKVMRKELETKKSKEVEKGTKWKPESQRKGSYFMPTGQYYDQSTWDSMTTTIDEDDEDDDLPF